jgi:hypothetical protein
MALADVDKNTPAHPPPVEALAHGFDDLAGIFVVYDGFTS